MTEPIRLALLGAGIFAQEAHLPALLSPPLRDRVTIAAVYSRTEATARQLAALLPYKPAIYTDQAELLARNDIDAVDIVLPIPLLPEAVLAALAAGKHVISEKPIAPTVAAGRALLARCQEMYADRVWMVAENWRYESAFVRAAAIIQDGGIGRPLLMHWIIQTPMTPANRYYFTQWRKAGDFAGGMLLDGGVHRAAVLRMLLGEVTGVSAITAQLRDEYPPADTMSASFTFASGAVGTHAATYTEGSPWVKDLHLVGERGALRAGPGIVELTTGDETRITRFEANDGVRAEFIAFADAVQGGAPHRNTPQEALRDVAVIEAVLRSGETGRLVVPEAVV